MKVITTTQVTTGGAVHHDGGQKGNTSYRWAGCGASPRSAFKITSKAVTCAKCIRIAENNIRDGI